MDKDTCYIASRCEPETAAAIGLLLRAAGNPVIKTKTPEDLMQWALEQQQAEEAASNINHNQTENDPPDRPLAVDSALAGHDDLQLLEPNSIANEEGEEPSPHKNQIIQDGNPPVRLAAAIDIEMEADDQLFMKNEPRREDADGQAEFDQPDRPLPVVSLVADRFGSQLFEINFIANEEEVEPPVFETNTTQEMKPPVATIDIEMEANEQLLMTNEPRREDANGQVEYEQQHHPLPVDSPLANDWRLFWPNFIANEEVVESSLPVNNATEEITHPVPPETAVDIEVEANQQLFTENEPRREDADGQTLQTPEVPAIADVQPRDEEAMVEDKSLIGTAKKRGRKRKQVVEEPACPNEGIAGNSTPFDVTLEMGPQRRSVRVLGNRLSKETGKEPTTPKPRKTKTVPQKGAKGPGVPKKLTFDVEMDSVRMEAGGGDGPSSVSFDDTGEELDPIVSVVSGRYYSDLTGMHLVHIEVKEDVKPVLWPLLNPTEMTEESALHDWAPMQPPNSPSGEALGSVVKTEPGTLPVKTEPVDEEANNTENIGFSLADISLVTPIKLTVHGLPLLAAEHVGIPDFGGNDAEPGALNLQKIDDYAGGAAADIPSSSNMDIVRHHADVSNHQPVEGPATIDPTDIVLPPVPVLVKDANASVSSPELDVTYSPVKRRCRNTGWICRDDSCRESFPNKKAWEGHMETVHPSLRLRSPAPFPSTPGTAVITTPSSTKKPKQFACDQCDHAYTSIVRLRSHKRAHSAERPYDCKKCGRTCSSLAGLQKHEKVHK